jgi:predicted dehydrogenase
MSSSPPIGVGLVGAGFLAETRARCYGRIKDVIVAAITSRTMAHGGALAQRHGILDVEPNLDALLARPDIQIVDLCVPNHLHRTLAERALRAGKHVVCTKPLTAYTGQDLGVEPADEAISGQDRSHMRQLAVADAQAMVDVAKECKLELMYGENWLFAPAMERAFDLLQNADARILEMRGGESHSGSHSPYAKRWRHTGGGALLRLGAHPIGTMIYLKHTEGLRRKGRPIKLVSVTAEVGDLTQGNHEEISKLKVASGWVDVENWGCAVLSFEDGSRGIALGSDNVLGGMQSQMEIMASNCRFQVNLSPNDSLSAYAPSEQEFAGSYLMEKLSNRSGWSTPMPEEDRSSGHEGMLREFVTSVREGRPSRSTGELGVAVVDAVYAAYESAASGCRVLLRT